MLRLKSLVMFLIGVSGIPLGFLTVAVISGHSTLKAGVPFRPVISSYWKMTGLGLVANLRQVAFGQLQHEWYLDRADRIRTGYWAQV